MLDDITMQALHASLSGLSTRQRAIADNLANVNTPGFLARKVQFEDSLRTATANGTPGAARPEVLASLEPTNTNGNNVNLDEEVVSLTDTGLRYQLDIEALTTKFKILRSSIGDGGF